MGLDIHSVIRSPQRCGHGVLFSREVSRAQNGRAPGDSNIVLSVTDETPRGRDAEPCTAIDNTGPVGDALVVPD